MLPSGRWDLGQQKVADSLIVQLYKVTAPPWILSPPDSIKVASAASPYGDYLARARALAYAHPCLPALEANIAQLKPSIKHLNVPSTCEPACDDRPVTIAQERHITISLHT